MGEYRKRNTMQSSEYRVYNLIFPVYGLLLFPNPLWALLIPLNYMIDRFILSLGLQREHVFDHKAEQKAFLDRTAWKVCIAGFAADFIGASIIIFRDLYKPFFSQETMLAINYAVYGTPFSSSAGLIVFLLAILIAGICIFLFDRYILIKAGLAKQAAVRIALLMAVITAPYVILVPTNIFY